MKLQALGCPSCQQPFQVAETQAGQVVACPSCAQPIEIPADIFAEPQEVAQPQQVQTCGTCSGQFGITPDMFGQTVGCPHCQATVEIGFDGSEKAAVPAPPEPDFKIKSKKTRWKSSSKVKSSKAKYRKKVSKIKPIERGAEAEDSPVESQRRAEPGKLPDKNVPSPPRKSSKENGNATVGSSDLVPPKKKRVAKTHSVDLDRSEPPSKEYVDKNVSTVADTVTNEHLGAELDGLTSEADMQGGAVPLDTSPVVAVLEKEDTRVSIEHLLPPRFDVLDPSRLKMSREESEFKVLLPDGDGGTKQVDNRVVRVSHAGEQVSLVASSDKEKSRRRMIQNVIAILIGVLILAGAFWLLG
ncbi:MAG: hypothetical protein ACPIA2_14880 [Mariniblastus sp.]